MLRALCKDTFNTDVIGVDCVENQVTPKGNQTNSFPQFRAQGRGFRVVGDFDALISDFLMKEIARSGLSLRYSHRFLQGRFRQ